MSTNSITSAKRKLEPADGLEPSTFCLRNRRSEPIELRRQNWSPRPCSGRRPPVYKTGALPLSYAGGKVEPSLEIGSSCSPYQDDASPAMLRRQKCCCRPALRRAACRPQTGEGDPMQRTPPGSGQRTRPPCGEMVGREDWEPSRFCLRDRCSSPG